MTRKRQNTYHHKKQCQNARSWNSYLQVSPVPEKVRHDRQDSATYCPQELMGHAEYRPLLGRKQLCGHDETSDIYTLKSYKFCNYDATDDNIDVIQI